MKYLPKRNVPLGSCIIVLDNKVLGYPTAIFNCYVGSGSYFLLSVITSLIAHKLPKALVASKGINTLLASPLATSSKASKDFNCTNLSLGSAFFIASYTI